MRARIDGIVVELDSAPKLDVRRKHTVEAIVDRFKVRPDLAQRLAESFETALRLGQGVARVAYTDEPQRAGLTCSPTSSRVRCAIIPSASSSRACSRSTARPAPARPATASVPRISSIPPRSSRIRICRSRAARCAAGTGATPIISSCCTRWPGMRNSTSRRPFETLPEAVRQLVLFGSGERGDRVQVPRRQGRHGPRQHAFEGIVQESRAPLPRDRIRHGARGARANTAPRVPAPTATARA